MFPIIHCYTKTVPKMWFYLMFTIVWAQTSIKTRLNPCGPSCGAEFASCWIQFIQNLDKKKKKPFCIISTRFFLEGGQLSIEDQDYQLSIEDRDQREHLKNNLHKKIREEG